jgi:hypothetical protein
MQKLTFEECPKTKAAFIERWNTDRKFRGRAQWTGFDVLFGSIVVLPNGKIAGAKVK